MYLSSQGFVHYKLGWWKGMPFYVVQVHGNWYGARLITNGFLVCPNGQNIPTAAGGSIKCLCGRGTVMQFNFVPKIQLIICAEHRYKLLNIANFEFMNNFDCFVSLWTDWGISEQLKNWFFRHCHLAMKFTFFSNPSAYFASTYALKHA